MSLARVAFVTAALVPWDAATAAHGSSAQASATSIAQATPAPPSKPAPPGQPGTIVAGEPNPSAPPAKLAPAAELIAAAKVIVGTWRCSGTMSGADGTAQPAKATVRAKLDLDKFWLLSTFEQTSGSQRYKFTSFRTFDGAAKRWTNILLDNVGGHGTTTSADGITWSGESTGPMGPMKIQDTEAVVSPREVKMTGRFAKDGKTWMTGYDLTCKKA